MNLKLASRAKTSVRTNSAKIELISLILGLFFLVMGIVGLAQGFQKLDMFLYLSLSAVFLLIDKKSLKKM